MDRIPDALREKQERFLDLTARILWHERYRGPAPKYLQSRASALLAEIANPIARCIMHGTKARRRHHVAVDSFAEEGED